VLSYDLIASQRIDEATQAIRQAEARKLDDPVLRQVLYALAFLKMILRDSGTSCMVHRQSCRGELWLSLEADTAAYGGHLRRAGELTGQSVDSAVRNGHKESAAIWLANAA